VEGEEADLRGPGPAGPAVDGRAVAFGAGRSEEGGGGGAHDWTVPLRSSSARYRQNSRPASSRSPVARSTRSKSWSADPYSPRSQAARALSTGTLAQRPRYCPAVSP